MKKKKLLYNSYREKVFKRHITKLNNEIIIFKDEIQSQEESLRESEIMSTTTARQLSAAKNELSGALRTNDALEDELDERKRKIYRLEKDLIDVEKERNYLKDRLIEVRVVCCCLFVCCC